MTDETLFDAALEIPDPAGRRAFLDEACRGDDRLRQQIDELLAAHEQASGFLGDTELHTGGTASWPGEPPPGPGAVIAGRYRILDRLGEGGMGTVWLADQTEPVKRRVALKLIKTGMDSRSVLARFEGERQALAVMDHPNIAKVFDGGTTDRRPLAPREESPLAEREVYVGRPFFVMEYVKGVPLTEYCDHQRLTVEARLQLFVHICRAVQHAHQKGVVHRDLKPSNILVCNYDGKPVPKIIDFGLAKALHQPFTETGQQTAQGLMLGTPVYMSPEQAGLNDLDIDTRADIYSLGVILYELLTGSPPFTLKEMRAAALTELIRIIREVEPPRPSTRLQSSTEMATVAANRGLEPKRLKNLVTGELDWIVMKCLEKERGGRYETAGALALDIERHLRNEPVEAGPPSTAYRLKKFLRRNRGAVAAATLIVLALVAGIIGTTSQALRAENARAEQEKLAERERLAKLEAQKERDDKEKARQREAEQRHLAVEAEADTRAFSQFLVEQVLSSPRPEGVQDGIGVDVKMSQALDAAEKEIERVFYGRPKAEATARQGIGVTWRNLGKYTEAERHLRRAVELRRQTLGPDHALTLNSMNSLAVAIDHLGKHGEAIELLMQVRDARARSHGPEHPHTLDVLQSLAVAYKNAGKPAEAIKLLQAVRDIQLKELDADEPELLSTLNELAVAYLAAGRLGDGIRLLVQVRDARIKKLGPEHPNTLGTLHNLGIAYQTARRFPEAIELFTKVRDARAKKLGPSHPHTLGAQRYLGVAYVQAGKTTEAIPLLEQVRDELLKTLPPDHSLTLGTLDHLALAYRTKGRSAEAISLSVQVYETYVKSRGPEHPTTLVALNNLAMTRAAAGQLDQAIALYEQLVPVQRRTGGEEHPQTLQMMANLGACYHRAGRSQEGIRLMEDAQERIARQSTETRASLQSVQTMLIRTYEEVGEYGKAAVHRREQLAAARKEYPAGDPRLTNVLAALGRNLLRGGKPSDAEPLLRECLSIQEEKNPGAWAIFHTKSLLGATLSAQGKHTDAEPLLLAAYQGMRLQANRSPQRTRDAEVPVVLERLVQLYTAWGKPDEAAKWRKELEASKPAKEPGTPKPDPTKPG